MSLEQRLAREHTPARTSATSADTCYGARGWLLKLVFLHKNSKWLAVDNQSFYNFTVWVAQSPAELKDEVVKGIEKYIKAHISDLDKLKKNKKAR